MKQPRDAALADAYVGNPPFIATLPSNRIEQYVQAKDPVQ